MNTACARARSVVALATLGWTLVSFAPSQCPAPTWSAMNPQWLPGGARASIAFDFDGAGPQPPVLVMGGAVTNQTQNTLVTWDGTRFQSFGSGVSGMAGASVNAFAEYNGQLIAAGAFTNISGSPANSIARWNGTSWQQLGSGISGTVNALAVYNGELIAGGSFTSAGGVPAARIARWNGSSWLPLGEGVNDIVRSLAIWGGNLIVGGEFTFAGTAAANRVATWDGTSWGTLGLAMSHAALPVPVAIATLAVHNGDLIAGGNFPLAGTTVVNCIARWDGSDWQALGSGMAGSQFAQPYVRALTTYQGDLIAGGTFGTAGGIAANSIARWNGTSWQAIDVGTGPDLRMLTVFNSDLIAGGTLGWGLASTLRFDGSHWSPMGAGLNNNVLALNVHDGALVAAGWIAGVGGNAWNRVVRRWDGSSWTTLGAGLNDRIDVLGVHNGVLYAGGGFTATGEGVPSMGFAQWNGSAWVPVGGGMNGGVRAITTYNGELIAGGYFSIAGGVPANRVARWNGTSWQAMGSGMPGVNEVVNALAVYNGELVAAGRFSAAGGVAVNNIARWNGSTWQPLGGGLTGNAPFLALGASASTLAVYNGELMVGGVFVNAGGSSVSSIARWNGSTWQPVGSASFPSAPATLTVYGGDLIAGNSSGVKRWDGSSWSLLGTGISGTVNSSTHFAGELFVGGTFASAGGVASPLLAKWGSPLPLIAASQPQGNGTGTELVNRRLIPGHEYYNFVSPDLAPGGVGTGPYGGLWSNDVGLLLAQLSLPAGALPFHYITPVSELTFGPYPLPPGLVFEAICVDATDGVIGCLAPAMQYTVH